MFVTFERAADMRRALAGHRVGLVQSTFNVHLGFWFWPLPFPSQLDWCDARARSPRPSPSPSLPPSFAPPRSARREALGGRVRLRRPRVTPPPPLSCFKVRRPQRRPAARDRRRRPRRARAALRAVAEPRDGRLARARRGEAVAARRAAPRRRDRARAPRRVRARAPRVARPPRRARARPRLPRVRPRVLRAPAVGPGPAAGKVGARGRARGPPAAVVARAQRRVLRAQQRARRVFRRRPPLSLSRG